MLISWNSRAGLTYSVMRSTDLANGFEPIATGVAATPPENAYIDPSPPASGLIFYTIRVE